MRVFNNYLVSLVVAACLINTLLTLFSQLDLSLYIIINTIAYMLITLYFASVNLPAKRSIFASSAMTFCIFLVAAIIKAWDIISS